MSYAYPTVGIPVDVKLIEGSPFHMVGEKYINAIAHGSQCFPVLIPAFGKGLSLKSMFERYDLFKILDSLDGVFLPGSASNVNPSYYNAKMETEGLPVDSQRDNTTLDIVKYTVEHHIPLFGICRGFQEMNVALGGSLYQKVHEIEGFNDHREDSTQSKALQYQKAHYISLVEGGVLDSLSNNKHPMVNSLHGQGVNQLGQGLQIEATSSEDDLIEAFSLKDADTFALGVQWHPEWEYWQDELSIAMFDAFGRAVKQRFNEK